MDPLSYRTLDGDTRELSTADFEDFARSLSGAPSRPPTRGTTRRAGCGTGWSTAIPR